MPENVTQRITTALASDKIADELVALVAELSSAGWARLEVYQLFHNFWLCLPDNAPHTEPLEVVLDRISGWCAPTYTLLPDEPINQLGIFRSLGVSEAIISVNESEPACSEFISDVFYIGKTDGEFLTLRQAGKALRVRPDGVQRIRYEGFYAGDFVQTKPQDGTSSSRQGQIFRLLYHYQKQQLLYYLTGLNGEKISKRYFAQDLQPISRSGIF
ncbi:MAG: hypothetical protein ACRYFX_28185 [Janthinobacterium lividum]